MNKILVTGATGHLGTAVIETLLTKIPSNNISILTRNVEKQHEFFTKNFNAFLGNYDNVHSIEKAMQGVDTVLLIASGDQGDRMQEHRNVVDTAKKLGVKHIAYTSRCLKNRNTLTNELMMDHFDTENYILESGLNHTFFRNILYMDSIPQFIGGNTALKNGIYLPAGDGKVSFALRSELGEAMANVLLNNKSENKIYNFTGDKSYSFYDIANALAELSGNVIQYTNLEISEYKKMMKQRNLPDEIINKIIDFITDIKHNQEADIYDDLEIQLGRKPTNLKNGLKVLYGF
jgi:NAD(P)H dehydrogenase (quinone)